MIFMIVMIQRYVYILKLINLTVKLAVFNAKHVFNGIINVAYWLYCGIQKNSKKNQS